MLESVRNAATSVADAVGRLFAPPIGISVASSGAALAFAEAEYDAEHAGSAIAAYPWARVGVDAIATNLSQVPIVALDANGERVTSHWILDLLRRPQPSMGGKRWRRQMVADFMSSGNMFAVKVRDSAGRTIRLRRRHPRGWSVETDRLGDISAWIDSSGKRYSPDEVFHVGDISWRDDAALSHIGESRIRPLDLGIRAATAARAQAGKAAKRGRLETLVTTDGPLGPDGADKLSDRFEDVRRKGNGTIVAGGGLKVIPLSLSPRDTEWDGLDTRTSVEALAVMGVPPVRAQLPSANYGAAKQEMRQYWENLQAIAELIDEELTELANGEVTVRHSFEKVEALQTSYTERLSRVQQWVNLGATPYEAAKFEQFVDAPLTPDTEPRAATQHPPPNPALQVDTPQAQSMAADIARTLQDAAGWLQDAVSVDLLEMPSTRYMLTDRLSDGPLSDRAASVADELIDAAIQARRIDGGTVQCRDLAAFGTDYAAALAAEMEHQHA